MSDEEASKLLYSNLTDTQKDDGKSAKLLLQLLANLPLAIKQATSYMALNTEVTVSDYLEFCKTSDAEMIDMLSRDFPRVNWYQGAKFNYHYLVDFVQPNRTAKSSSGRLYEIYVFLSRERYSAIPSSEPHNTRNERSG
jgi:hypothetical protein